MVLEPSGGLGEEWGIFGRFLSNLLDVYLRSRSFGKEIVAKGIHHSAKMATLGSTRERCSSRDTPRPHFLIRGRGNKEGLRVDIWVQGVSHLLRGVGLCFYMFALR